MPKEQNGVHSRATNWVYYSENNSSQISAQSIPLEKWTQIMSTHALNWKEHASWTWKTRPEPYWMQISWDIMFKAWVRGGLIVLLWIFNMVLNVPVNILKFEIKIFKFKDSRDKITSICTWYNYIPKKQQREPTEKLIVKFNKAEDVCMKTAFQSSSWNRFLKTIGKTC